MTGLTEAFFLLNKVLFNEILVAKRAENRNFHFTYRVTCSYNGQVFYGLHSADELDTKFSGKGTALYESIKDYGQEQHRFERLELHPTRALAKAAYNELKASQLANPIRSEDKKFHFLYKTTRFDGKYYIGVHSTDDLDDGYKGSGTYIGRSLKKHGRENHERVILMKCQSRAQAYQCEAVAVTQEFLDQDLLCMNKIPGGRQHGDRVYGFTDETRKLLRAASKAAHARGAFDHLKGKPQSPLSIIKRVTKNTGKTRTSEQLVNLAAGQQAYYASVDQSILQSRGQAAAQTRIERGTSLGGRPKGIPMTETQKAEQSARTKGKIFSEDHKAALRVPKTRISCALCHKETTTSHLPRYHASCTKYTDHRNPNGNPSNHRLP